MKGFCTVNSRYETMPPGECGPPVTMKGEHPGLFSGEAKALKEKKISIVLDFPYGARILPHRIGHRTTDTVPRYRRRVTKNASVETTGQG